MADPIEQHTGVRPDLFRGVRPGRWTPVTDQPFVLFLIGMRINTLWKPWAWAPVLPTMPAMLRELSRQPELGYLGGDVWLGRTILCVQYWKDFDSLEGYARNAEHLHLPAWKKFNQLRGNSTDVGVWHETYEIRPGNWESIYVNMPAFGLGKVFPAEQISGARDAARGRRDRKA
ncbi:MAG: DUF4188 domain-containing protein [Anderseniella sp.]|jgi:hypothetical protein|nr:DUF4188 domain-containing protein [Anderseniella sp.]